MIHVITDGRTFIPLVVTSTTVVLAGLLSPDFQHELERPLFHVFGTLLPVTWWRISHMLLYKWFGFWFPHHIVLFFTLGVMWEVTEWALGKIYNKKYMVGTGEDIVFNMIGFNLGTLLTLLTR
jgi:hypothetical protein